MRAQTIQHLHQASCCAHRERTADACLTAARLPSHAPAHIGQHSGREAGQQALASKQSSAAAARSCVPHWPSSTHAEQQASRPPLLCSAQAEKQASVQAEKQASRPPFCALLASLNSSCSSLARPSAACRAACSASTRCCSSRARCSAASLAAAASASW